jgi:hypothetical protein
VSGVEPRWRGFSTKWLQIARLEATGFGWLLTMAMQCKAVPHYAVRRRRGFSSENDCAVCGDWPATDREGMRGMIYQIPLQGPICDKCIVAFWNNISREPEEPTAPAPHSN